MSSGGYMSASTSTDEALDSGTVINHSLCVEMTNTRKQLKDQTRAWVEIPE